MPPSIRLLFCLSFFTMTAVAHEQEHEDVRNVEISEPVSVQKNVTPLPEARIVKVNNKYGYQDKHGKFTVPAIYGGLIHDAMVHKDFIAVRDGKYGIVTKMNKVVLPFKYLHIRAFHEGYYAVMDKDSLVGLFHEDGRWACKPTYAKIAQPFVKLYYITDLAGHIGLMDTTGTEWISPKYKSLGIVRPYRFGEERLFATDDHDNIGMVDLHGKVYIPVEHDKIQNERRNFFTVLKGRQVGAFDNFGNILVPVEYDMFKELGKEYNYTVLAKKDGKSEVFAADGKKLTPEPFDALRVDHDFIISVQGFKRGLFDKDYNVILKNEYESIYVVGLREGVRIAVGQGDLYALYDEKGVKLTDYKYNRFDNVGCATVLKALRDQKYGLIGIDGKELSEFIYDYIMQDGFGGDLYGEIGSKKVKLGNYK